MQNHDTFLLYLDDGSTVSVKNFYRSPAAQLAEYLTSNDGRVIYCLDEKQGIFWYKDTEEKLYRHNPHSTTETAKQ